MKMVEELLESGKYYTHTQTQHTNTTHTTQMSPISIVNMKFAAKHMINFSTLPMKTSKSYLSYSIARQYVHESNYYSQAMSQNHIADSHINNNGSGSVEHSEMKFVKNVKHSDIELDEHDVSFVPQVSSNDDSISGSGHSRI